MTVWFCAVAAALIGLGCVTPAASGLLLYARQSCCVLAALLLLALHLFRLQWCVWVLHKCIFSVVTWLRNLLLGLDVPLLLRDAETHAHISSCHFVPWCPVITPALHACCPGSCMSRLTLIRTAFPC